MTKKDYIVIANAIAKVSIDIDDDLKAYPADKTKLIDEKIGFNRLVNYLTGNLYADNPRFDLEKFYNFIEKKRIELNK